ncbi:type I DNA topoisomerase [Miniphocaeibacter halophilus]|uniref:Type I DNA topoisomerase n=1 Tax=Miniphocaeibacter halophilus TaxID=2931922 RepID=A0AC61MQ18_9FIRM|nr:type I DNA topoisomerase [Miniphocaeibacter halophilus]QQK07686.1 type I DNA topoisomerase [Miniphocaeibacter halophilus]
MAKNLVIVESPTKAKTIGKMLGSNYKVVASVGHLRDLPKSKMGIDIENNFEPQYINVRGKGDIIKELKKQAKKSEKVFLATDPDREGEAISWHLSNLLGLDPNEKNRVEFNEITKSTVKEAVKNPRKIDMNLVNAQQARRVLDRLVGYEISPVLWKKVKSGLSAGRVQSVALRLLCEREKEIREFVPKEYWSIEATHLKDKINFESSFYGELVKGKEEKKELKNINEAEEIISNLDLNNFMVSNIKKTKKKRNPYPPYTTSTLQQDANRKLGFSASKTMSVAQQLYEGISIGNEGTVGLISYMRTDSTRISKDIINEALEYIKNKYGSQYASKGNSYGKNKKGAQDAHEAIRPSSIIRTPDSLKDYLSNDQYKLYRLIWNRVVASQMTQSQYESTNITLLNNNFVFKANGNIELFKGFTIIYSVEDKNVLLPTVEENEIINTSKIDKTQHFTKPKARFTEASLVKTLEEDGIGRPSTYASIISSLLKRNYVKLDKKKFFTTELGENVNAFLLKYFSDIINQKFTAEMEDELDKIEEYDLDWKNTISKFYDSLEENLAKAKSDTNTYKVEDKKIDEFCPECGSQLVIKHGRNGEFIGCSGFPNCKYTKAIIKGTGVKCPKCGGEIIEKVSKRGKLFYGCSNYPNCDFAVWDKPIDEKCPKCNSILVHKKNRKVDEIKCSNEKCDYVK